MKKILLTILLLLSASYAGASDLSYEEKVAGDKFTAADANEVKAAVNSKADVTGEPVITLGTQGTTEGKIRVTHADPSGNADAYFGIMPETSTWTNNGTYYNNVSFFGWNPDGAQIDEPKVGMSVESKYSQGSGQPFGTEFHLVSSFPDTTAVRYYTNWTDRAAPHLSQTGIAGQVDFTTSRTDVTQEIRARFYEDGNVVFAHPASAGNPVIKINGYGWTESASGKGQMTISATSDRYPYLEWKKSASTKARWEVDLDTGNMLANVGYVADAMFEVRGGPLWLTPGSGDRAILVYGQGSDYIFFTQDGANAKYRVTGSGDTIQTGNLTITPSASQTPAVNGQLTLEATSNTSVTVKLKGSDGVVRSAVLTMAP